MDGQTPEEQQRSAGQHAGKHIAFSADFLMAEAKKMLLYLMMNKFFPQILVIKFSVVILPK